MEGPDHRLAAAAEVVEEKPQVDVVAVEIVEPDHIRVVFPDLGEKGLGGGIGAEASCAEYAVPQSVEVVVQLGADGQGLHIPAALGLPAVGQQAGVSRRLELPGGLQHQLAGAAGSCGDVDKQVFHGFASPPSRSRKRLTYFRVQISGV